MVIKMFIKRYFISTTILSIILGILAIFFISNTKDLNPDLLNVITSLPKPIQIILGYGVYDTSTTIGNLLNVLSYISLAYLANVLFISLTAFSSDDKISLTDIAPISKNVAFIKKIISTLLLALYSLVLFSVFIIVIILIKDKTILNNYLFYLMHIFSTTILFIGLGLIITKLKINKTLIVSILLLIIYSLFIINCIFDLPILNYIGLTAILTTSKINIIYVISSIILGTTIVSSLLITNNKK